MAAGIGTSHFLSAPTAGAAFGYALAWTVLAAHLLKYPAFDYASRYTHATGDLLLEGFADLGPGNWTVGLFGAAVALEGVLILAGVASVFASALIAGFPSVPFGFAVIGCLVLTIKDSQIAPPSPRAGRAVDDLLPTRRL